MATHNVWASARRPRLALCECGVEFMTTSDQARWCLKCRNKRSRASSERSLAIRKAEHAAAKRAGLIRAEGRRHSANVAYEVVSDPTGDFQPGARFGVEDVSTSLELNVLPVGLQLRELRTGRVVTVIATEGGGQTLDHRAPKRQTNSTSDKMRAALAELHRAGALLLREKHKRTWSLAWPGGRAEAIHGRTGTALLKAGLIEKTSAARTPAVYVPFRITAAGIRALRLPTP